MIWICFLFLFLVLFSSVVYIKREINKLNNSVKQLSDTLLIEIHTPKKDEGFIEKYQERKEKKKMKEREGRLKMYKQIMSSGRIDKKQIEVLGLEKRLS